MASSKPVPAYGFCVMELGYANNGEGASGGGDREVVRSGDREVGRLGGWEIGRSGGRERGLGAAGDELGEEELEVEEVEEGVVVEVGGGVAGGEGVEEGLDIEEIEGAVDVEVGEAGLGV